MSAEGTPVQEVEGNFTEENEDVRREEGLTHLSGSSNGALG
jgi:hypothetical protein